MSTVNVRGDYSFDRLPERAAEARKVLTVYVADRERAYGIRRRHRNTNSVQTVSFCGMGRAGKDTAGEYVGKHFDVKYPRSASWIVLPLVAHMAGVPDSQAWVERHNNRVFWLNACNAIRGDDFACLARWCLGDGDMAIGLRAKPEFEQIVKSRMIDWIIWIDNPRVPDDITVECTAGSCDLVIPNHGTLDEFYAKLDKVMPALLGRVKQNDSQLLE